MNKKRWAYPIEITLVKGEGECTAGHKVGDKFTVAGDTEQFRCDPLCIHALASMLPKIEAMRYGADLPWLKENPDVSAHLCPDAANPHVFELRRKRD
jgi:uncharacterized repeat protein (TIGR04076 family)